MPDVKSNRCDAIDAFVKAFPPNRKIKYKFGFSSERGPLMAKICVYDLETNVFIGAFLFDEPEMSEILDWANTIFNDIDPSADVSK